MLGTQHINMDRRTIVELTDLAARIMMESGLDWAGARKKAADRLGIAAGAAAQVDERDVHAALRAHQALYAPDSAGTLRALQEAALLVMRKLHDFEPRLEGAIAAGVVTAHSAIELTVEVDSEKDLEHHLLNANISFEVLTVKRSNTVKYRCAGSDPVVLIAANIRGQRSHKYRGTASNNSLTLGQLESLLNATTASD